MSSNKANLSAKQIDLLLKVILNSKNIHGIDLDMLVGTIKELQKLKYEIANPK
tara:strand:- start:532 stop:690 length:159 start_codon:yes stop_codon:yes gene_type:complete